MVSIPFSGMEGAQKTHTALSVLTG